MARHFATVILILSLGARPLLVEAAVRGQCTEETYNAWDSGWPRVLDWGIWWFGPHDAKEKAIKGKESKLFDPSKKTVIFIHGWAGNQGGSTASCYRPTTECDADVCPDRRMLMDAWFAKGWNVGFFFWDQFADEPCARDAEQKVWFDKSKLGLRYATYHLGEEHSQYQIMQAGFDSVADLCTQAIDDVMGDFSGPEFRLVGHSLGSQVATRCAALLKDGRRQHKTVPTRLVLLDPFFTERHMMGLVRCHDLEEHKGIGEYSLKEATKYINTLYENGVPTVVHISSPFPESSVLGDTIFPFEPIVVLVKHRITWCGKVDAAHALTALSHISCEHKSAVVVYFLASEEVPDHCVPWQPFACTDKQIWELQTYQLELAAKGHQRMWIQDNGRHTRDPDDDDYRIAQVELSRREKASVKNIRAVAIHEYHSPLASGSGGLSFGSLAVAALMLVGIVLGVAYRRRSNARSFSALEARGEAELGPLVAAE
eukprot:TRINITY_DN22259_c0_g1_i1.p1 TRINITY_DN22259_c0_g1~~TRINITY_DN22259_c0_g1_i1.p1  ORF type:complete len:485 (-),score=77.74 TRINITY_DN22259_c0_g1_i1:223-1677(-)